MASCYSLGDILQKLSIDEVWGSLLRNSMRVSKLIISCSPCTGLKARETYNPMDDEPMWAADRVVALTPDFIITIPETVNEFASKEMPDYGKFLKELVSNKHKLEQISSAILSDESSAMIQNKVSPKLGDPKSFLIPCTFSKAFSCKALADIGASINLMPYSLYVKLSLETLKPTKMSIRYKRDGDGNGSAIGKYGNMTACGFEIRVNW
ncbi:reverse transcriptase domain-containing protein [Tanacetum coccineum]